MTASTRIGRTLGAVAACIFAFVCGVAQADSCDESTIRAALTNGGNYTFDSGCSISLSSALVIPAGVTATLDAGSNTVTLTHSSGRMLFVSSNATLVLKGFAFLNGQAVAGGAIFIEPDANLFLTNCVFISNKATGDSGTDGDNGSDQKWNNGGDGKRGLPGDDAFGGAICNLGSLFITRCQFLTNSASGGNGGNGGNGGTSTNYYGGDGGPAGIGGSAFGGAIYSQGPYFVVNQSTFAGNVASGGDGGTGGEAGTGNWGGGITGDGARGGAALGGGLYCVSAYTNYLFNSTFSDNAANGGAGTDGGGSSTGVANGGARGGNAAGAGVYNVGWLQVVNNTFYRNLASGGAAGNGGSGSRGGNGGNGGTASGGGLCNTGEVYLINCTFAFNGVYGGTNGTGGTGINNGRSGQKGGKHGGNIANLATKKSGLLLYLKNTIIGTNLSGGGGFGRVDDLGNNISADKSLKLKSVGSRKKTDPGLAAFGDYGGPTKTIALLTNSVAIDAGDDSVAPPTDQRGAPREGTSDIGAFEAGPLFIEDQPQSLSVSIGASAMFSVSVLGDPPLSYQWYFDNGTTNSAIAGATSSSFTISSVSTNDAGDYFVVVSNNEGSRTSDVATLTVVLSPSIITQPTNQNVLLTNSATFSVVAAGLQPLFYQWYATNNASSNAVPLLNGTNASFTIASVTTNDIGGYFVVVTNSFGSVTSGVANLTVQLAPLITTQPTNQVVATNGTANFSVTAVGAAPLHYQWLFNTTNYFVNQTNATLTITNVQSTNAGRYSVVVTNSFGWTLSSNATLTVSSSGPPAP